MNTPPFVAFPIETVTANGAFAGFTMRKATGMKLMHRLCTPADRKTEFPDANFRFLVRVAFNFTRAIASIISLGVVIGDINESGALVDQKGLVTVIDIDSFQYLSGGQLFRCRVGKPEYTPPELQGQSFEKVDRTVNHDAFGVAVIIFEFLFMGRHPFSGVYKGTGDQLSILRAIQEGRFAYSQHRSLTQMEPPPNVPVLAEIPIDMAAAFQRVFGSPALKVQARPTAAEWVPLKSMEKSIIECKANPAHYFSGAAPSCPWCRIKNHGGNDCWKVTSDILPTRRISRRRDHNTGEHQARNETASAIGARRSAANIGEHFFNLAAARRIGRMGGRPPKLTDDDIEAAYCAKLAYVRARRLRISKQRSKCFWEPKVPSLARSVCARRCGRFMDGRKQILSRPTHP
jgi:serine/threonine protein kinase